MLERHGESEASVITIPRVTRVISLAMPLNYG
jgi:hypothetical protein